MHIKKVSVFALVCFLTTSLTAQISMSSDSVNNALCRKWEFKAIIMGGQRLSNMNETVIYEFQNDGTFKRVTSNGKSEKGTWVFKPDQKIVLLKLKKTVLHIPSLTDDELIVSPGEGINGAENGLSMGTVLKPSN
ncbi:hypothetical protein [Pollutibacter soli]|uniref:hypothetical protein n=1 Tax=Pollutibacter soli TaxID=3034157 RepID=UPI003013C086